MGRLAGVTANETRGRLLRGARAEFAKHGFARASVSSIASSAGLTTGAVYGHFGGKADLFIAVLQEHAGAALDDLVAGEDSDLLSFLRARGEAVRSGDGHAPALLVEAVVAAQTDETVRAAVVIALRDAETRLTGAIRAAQDRGELTDAISPDTAVRFALTLGLGAVVVQLLELPPTSEADWMEMLDRLISAVRG